MKIIITILRFILIDLILSSLGIDASGLEDTEIEEEPF